MRNTKFFGLAIDTLTGSPLAIERVVEWTGAVQGDVLSASTLWWLHGISAEKFDNLPLQLPCALTIDM